MTHYIALIHKDLGSEYGVSFPDIPGIITCSATLDDAIVQAAQVLAFAADDWDHQTGGGFPPPRSLESLREDGEFLIQARDAVVVAIPLPGTVQRAA